MIQAGQRQTLRVIEAQIYGFMLEGDAFLPKRLAPEGLEEGHYVEAFIYTDSEGRLSATTQKPRAEVGQCAFLRVADVNDTGAFLDWGLEKHLLLPYREQKRAFEVGDKALVYIYLDPYGKKPVASTRLHRFLEEDGQGFKADEKVELLACGRSDLGVKMVINNTHLGLLFRDDVLQPVKVGQRFSGYIKSIRPDGKINVSLQLQGQEVRDELSDKILATLEANGGSSNLTDKSNPEDIFKAYQVSKKNYKKALGGLYKAKKILIEPGQITLPKG